MSDDNEKNGSDFDFDFDSFAEQSESVDTSQPFESNVLGGASPFAADDFELVTDDSSVSTDNPFFAESVPGAAKVDEPVPLKKPKKSKKPKQSTARESVFSTNDIPGILCLAAAGALLLIILVQNVMSLLFHTDSILCTICYVAAFDIIGLGIVVVPVLIYKRRTEIGLFNVLLGVSAVALFGGVLIMLTEFYHYGFVIKP